MRELWRRSPVLTSVALVHVALLVFTVVAAQVDHRTVLGLNTWTKPGKFMASISIYLFTLAWLVGELERRGRMRSVIIGGIAVAMITETVCLFIQGFRGTSSHYNEATILDQVVFTSMGLAIAIDTVMMVLLLLLFFRVRHLAPAYAWGIRFGIAVFLIGSYIGGQMIMAGAHTVGAADGGPGLPIVNFSTVAGDLRIAHALGLHGLQVLPLVGWWLAGRGEVGPGAGAASGSGADRSVLAIAAVSVVYVMIVLGAFLQARAGLPLLA